MDQCDTTGCAAIREVLSAVLDGEADGAQTARVRRHLDGCAACRRWRSQAELLTRAVRIAPVPAQPEIATRVAALLRPRAIDVVRGPAGAGLRLCARIALAAVSMVQLVISILVLAGKDAMHTADGMSQMAHLDHESAAWNLAVVAGLLWVTARPRKGVGALPLLAAFVLVLTGLCISDLIDGQVGPARVVLHVPVLVGLVLSVLVVTLHSGPSLPPGFTRRGITGGDVLDAAPAEEPAEVRARPPVARAG